MIRGERPLLVLLLPTKVEEMPEGVRLEQLLTAPGALAVEPPRLRLSTTFAAAVAPRQAKRLKLPGVPHAVGVLHLLQIPLAGALIQRHPEAELWALASEAGQADFAFDLSAAPDLRPAWERMERLGIETGRLGSERLR